MADGFVFYRSFADALDELDPEIFKEIMQAVYRYALDGIEPEDLSAMGKLAFSLIRPQIDANAVRRSHGQNGGRPKKEKPVVIESETSGYETENQWLLKNENLKTTGYETENQWLLENENLKTTGYETENHRLSDEKPKEKEKEKEKVNVKEKVKEKDKDICPEQAPADCEALPLNDGEEWRPTKADLDEWIRLYPAVDVKQEIRNMRGWCASNPSRRKTRAGIKRFVTAWLSREQSKPRAAPKPANAFVNFEQRNYDYAALERALLKGGSG